MTIISADAPSNVFAIAADVEAQILRSTAEDQKVAKTSVNDKSEILRKNREERIHNLEEHLRMLSGGHGGCLKFLKVVSIVASAVAAPLSFGSSLGLGAAVTSAMQIATAVMGGLSAITMGLDQLKEAARAKKILLNQADGRQILAIIDETQKWVEDEKKNIQEYAARDRRSLDLYKNTLKDLEQSFQTMIQV